MIFRSGSKCISQARNTPGVTTERPPAQLKLYDYAPKCSKKGQRNGSMDAVPSMNGTDHDDVASAQQYSRAASAPAQVQGVQVIPSPPPQTQVQAPVQTYDPVQMQSTIPPGPPQPQTMTHLQGGFTPHSQSQPTSDATLSSVLQLLSSNLSAPGASPLVQQLITLALGQTHTGFQGGPPMHSSAKAHGSYMSNSNGSTRNAAVGSHLILYPEVLPWLKYCD